MKTKTSNIKQYLNQDLVDFIVQSNMDLIEAEEMELYNQCAFIQSAIMLTLNNAAQTLSSLQNDLSTNEILLQLMENNQYCYESLKAARHEEEK